MSRPVHAVHTTDTIEDAAALLAGRRITAAPVFDAGGELVGMVSEGDLLWHRVPSDPTAHLRPAVAATSERPRLVEDVMSAGPLTTWPMADIADVAQMMLDADVRSVPVMDDGSVIGMISRRDILRTVVRTDDVVRHEVQHRLDEYTAGAVHWTVTVVDGAVFVEGPFVDDAEQTVVAILARTVPGVAEVHIGRLESRA